MDKTISRIKVNKIQIIIFLVVLLAIFIVTAPMSLNWVWNEDSWGHHGQYEKLTDAILEGHLYMDYEVDPKLIALENPYDRGQREANGVNYEFDHAFLIYRKKLLLAQELLKGIVVRKEMKQCYL